MRAWQSFVGRGTMVYFCVECKERLFDESDNHLLLRHSKFKGENWWGGERKSGELSRCQWAGRRFEGPIVELRPV